MAEKVKLFTSVKVYNKTVAIANKVNKLLKAMETHLKKLYGERGGKLELPDGVLALTAREGNGRDSVAYKGIVATIEADIRSGKMYQRNKADQIKFIEKNKKDNTNEQQNSQKIEGTETPVDKEVMSPA